MSAIDKAREAFEDSVRLFPGSGSGIPIFGHAELEALLEAVRAQERVLAFAGFDRLSITHKRTLIELTRAQATINALEAERDDYANQVINETAVALDARRERNVLAAAIDEAGGDTPASVLAVRIVKVQAALAEERTALAGLADATRAAMQCTCGKVVCDAVEALRVVLTAAPSVIAGQVRARHLREAAERVDDVVGDENIGWRCQEEVVDWLKALAKEAEG